MLRKELLPIILTLGRNMRERRESLALSQIAVAKAVGVTKQTISNIEVGNNSVSLELYYRLCRPLKWPVPPGFEKRKEVAA